MRAVTPLSLALALWLAGSTTVPAEPAPSGPIVAEALDAAARGEWTDATVLAGSTGAPVALDIVLWMRLASGAGEFDEYRRFLSRNADWPAMDALRRGAERAMPEGLPPATVTDFFADRAPLTGTGSLRLADALAATGREADAEAEITRAWTSFSLTPGERSAALDRWKAVLAPAHVARLDMLLWRGLTAEAQAMLPLVPEDWQKLAQARIATRKDTEGLQYAINTVPPSLRDDPGLAFERYLYRVTKGRWQEAEDFLLARSTSKTALGRPEFWMDRRANLARQALEDGDARAAYRIAAQSFGSEGPEYADAEWVAGFIALTRLDDPKRAVGHFTRFQSAVATPISLGRAGYWLGLAYRRLGDHAAAEHAFRAAAAWSTSFYGQLAAKELAADTTPDTAAGTPTDAPADAPGPDPDQAALAVPDWHDARLTGLPVVQAGLLLLRAGDERRGSTFLRAAAAGRPAAERAALAQMSIDRGHPEIGIRIAKDAANDGIVLPAQYYPLHQIAGETWPVAAAYALAIARQELEFDAGVASSAGARGLMQLMPATAKHVAETSGVPYDLARLSADPLYNARLGTSYLAGLLDRYDGSYLLATAAYNAGPGRVDQWLHDLGDPRTPDADPVGWIESIPYTETRNYVMRVLEGLEVYRGRLGDGAPPAPVEEAQPADAVQPSPDSSTG
ncbi:MAG: lytic transglycosylase domain-containing protein [Amaricoccus sp.]|uniref:lytic transglycosylase domain-containing protein n=1 Tax=Amaricoccus sp. TaxID=1872485 RepID=UPI0039E358DF